VAETKRRGVSGKGLGDRGRGPDRAAKNAGGGAGDIITRETFSSFILKVDFRLTDAANSGIKYFFDPALQGGTAPSIRYWTPSIPTPRKAATATARSRRFTTCCRRPGPSRNRSANGNTAMIVCRGGRVEHWLNGEKVLAFERGSEAFRQAVARSKFSKHPQWGEQSAGRILLQDHQDRVSYRTSRSGCSRRTRVVAPDESVPAREPNCVFVLLRTELDKR
jgi:hypothetical protein